MDEKRFDQLSRKRFEQGLTRDEADELGRMMAEKEGQPYTNADDLGSPERLPPEGPEPADEHPYSEAQVKELREHPDVKGSEERKAG